ncbi:hypothetical protein H632_c2384p0 [Helicosporidium sp. ATCC 50920]|nr:hypothetical protein H632_c2384p0 [Helicosporidium sp. ATCC 50920]|eukprot:KDD73246.1 hypothetical protein H632_c2384p0 [Helicosporidium sp. ATCC 50920]
MFNSLAVAGAGGKTVAVAGPREYAVRELLSAVHEVMREKDVSVPVPDAVARLAARCADALAAKTPFRLDPMFSKSSVDELLGNARRTLVEAQAADPGMWTAQDLEVEPLNVLEGHAIEYLRHYRIGGYSYGSHLAGGQGAVYRPPEAPGY